MFKIVAMRKIAYITIAVIAVISYASGFSFGITSNRHRLIGSTTHHQYSSPHFNRNYGITATTLSSSQSSSSSLAVACRDNSTSHIYSKVIDHARTFCKLMLNFVIGFIIGGGITPSRVLAAVKKKGKLIKKIATSNTAGATAAAAATTAGSSKNIIMKIPLIMKKVLAGANVTGKFKTWKVGDTRAEFAALLNTVSGFAILGFLASLAYIKHKQREMVQSSRATKELVKITQYKESMYFEAVQEVMTKIANPKTKGSTKANLQKQLKDLDPDGTIQKYLQDGGEKPDISHIINRKSKKKASKGTLKDRPNGDKKKAANKAAKSTMKADDNDYSDNGDVEDSNNSKSNNNKDSNISRDINSNSNSNSSGKSATATSSYQDVLDELYISLDGVIDDGARSKLLNFLSNRLETITDDSKRSATLTKIAQQLGNDEYWIAYSDKLN